MIRHPRVLFIGIVTAGLFGWWLPACVSSLGQARQRASAGIGRLDAPRLVLPRTHHNFGRISAGENVQARFVLINAGTRRLIIHEDGCGECTSHVDKRPLVIGPGEHREITVVFDSSGRYGAVECSFHYNTSDPQQPRFSLKLSGTVER